MTHFYLILPIFHLKHLDSGTMIKNYLTIAFRNFLRYKLYSVINILGLSIGIAFCILIYLFVQFEFSMDQFHKHKDRIYRVESVSMWGGALKRDATIPCPLAPALAEEIPGIEKSSRYFERNASFLLNGRKQEEHVQYVDTAFLEMFSFRLIRGNKTTALDGLYNAVISERIAQKYFGDTDPIGKVMQTEQRNFVVSGVVEDASKNSTLRADILLRIDQSICTDEHPWTTSFINAFVLVKPGTQQEDIIKQANEVYAKNFPSEDSPTTSFTSLTAVYFDQDVSSFGGKRISNPSYSYILGGITLLILLIACVNYILLSLANASSRTKEVGVRKVLGATRQLLRRQYLGEAWLLTFIALLLGLTLAQLFLPAFNEFTQRELTLSFSENKLLILALVIILLVTGFLAGSYPAYWLSRLLPAKILKGNTSYRIKAGLSNSLVTLQFSICVFFIICTLVMNRQLSYIREADLGFDHDLVVKIDIYRNSNHVDGKTIKERFENALQNEPDIEQMTATATFPGFCCAESFQYGDKQLTTDKAFVDYNFFNTLDIKITKGRSFSPDVASDSTAAVIINKALADELGYADPIGNIYPMDSSVIIGMVTDVHINSLEQKPGPALFQIGKPGKYESALLVKIRGRNIPSTIKKFEETWRSLISDEPMVYSFLDEEVARMYEDYNRWQRIISLSTFFGILIACMGLFGLSGLHAANKSKEIAIRKVLGANMQGLLFLLNKNTLWIALLAFTLAVPFGYYAMSKWLENFAYRIDLAWYWFAVACLLGICIVFFTVSYHTLKAATTNPVKSLKYE